ncbi:MAG: NAD(P)H-dependent glycerol-3-phosphate dehydrogenase [Gammaproteobacteria bacterium]|nr:NAD(P)H-dependent glycerol-3-phosphate dehydrogenase [Gammaproteobacteria bacterium]OUV68069.1 MAG: NAD(P)H-dependent glycerol-3-phosphate dehydrogenase [Gammaproteobacteria bacterium TMED133]
MTYDKVSILGSGSWGTTVGSLIARNASALIWGRNSDTVAEINQKHTNARYLGEIPISRKLTATTDLLDAAKSADVIVLALPSQVFRVVLNQIKEHIKPEVPIISLTKGLELNTRMRMTEVIADLLPKNSRGVLTGPNLAKEIISGSAAASVLAMEDQESIKDLQRIFHNRLFRVYTNHDVIGCELGGVLKNIIAIAAGIGDGLGAGDNARAAVITRGLAEMSRLGIAMGGESQTFAGLTGMGDLVATCTSAQSRNRNVGIALGSGKTMEEILATMFMVAEGIKSAPAVMALAKEHSIQMPIVEEVFGVVQGQRHAKDALKGVLRAGIGSEAEPN